MTWRRQFVWVAVIAYVVFMCIIQPDFWTGLLVGATCVMFVFDVGGELQTWRYRRSHQRVVQAKGEVL